jgi:hypothetical protein
VALLLATCLTNGSPVRAQQADPAPATPPPVRSAAAEPGAMPAFQRGDEVAGARWAVARLLRAKTLPELADCLSNETAGALGLAVVMPIAVGAGMAEEAKAQLKPTDVAAKTLAEYRALMNRYQMLDKLGEMSEDPKVLDRLLGQQGRRFLVDVDAMLERLGKAAQLSGDISQGTDTRGVIAGQFKTMAVAAPPSSLVYRVLGPRRVAIAHPRRPREFPTEARFDADKWRIHVRQDDEAPVAKPQGRATARPRRSSGRSRR